jgi:hypothetical protein
MGEPPGGLRSDGGQSFEHDWRETIDRSGRCREPPVLGQEKLLLAKTFKSSTVSTETTLA